MACGIVLHYFFDGNVGGETQRAEAQRHRVAERHHAAHNRPSHPFMLFGKPLERFAHGDNFARRLAAGNRPGVRGTHHHAFEHGLAADQSFFPALQRGQKLHGHQETHEISQRTHEC